jgi:hypothetical protein
VAEPDVARQGAEERDPLSDEHGHAGDDETLNEPLAQEPLDRDPAVDVEVVSAARREPRDDLRRRPPPICSTTPPRTTERSTGRWLRTTTRLAPYGQAPKVRTVSKVFRPITMASTLAMNSS